MSRMKIGDVFLYDSSLMSGSAPFVGVVIGLGPNNQCRARVARNGILLNRSYVFSRRTIKIFGSLEDGL